ncbi:hypothetical protein [Massilia sp. METH4]|uniref:hypothetical protein n=1 Tax=Massilia sp. METH4 TaxID=3123041 RepID=UPI0030CDEF14
MKPGALQDPGRILLADYLRMEGNYTFHAQLRHGECDGMRELVWTEHVDVGIDAGSTVVTADPLDPDADGRDCMRLTVTAGASDNRLFIWRVPFVCGRQHDDCCACAPVRPGRYAKEINIHNATGERAPVLEQVIPLVPAGAVRGREPRVAQVAARDAVLLSAHSATMDDCCRLQELLLGGPAGDHVPLSSGIVEIISTAELAVTVVYTTGSGAIDVETVAGRRLL